MSFYHQFRSANVGSDSVRAQANNRVGKTALLPNQSEIQVLVINRVQDKERLRFQTEQLDQLGLPFYRLDAYTPETLPKTIHRRFWRRWRHPMPEDMKAKFLSHAVAWEWVSRNGPALILEDDALLARSVPEILRNLESITNIDHLTLEARGRSKLLSNAHIPIGHGVSGHRLYLDRHGAAAYVLWPSGAAKLMRHTRSGAAPAEGMAQWARNLKSYQADPACAVQLDMAATYGLIEEGEVPSKNAARKQPMPVTPGQQIRSSLSKLHKIWRTVRYSMSATRRRVNVRPEFFD